MYEQVNIADEKELIANLKTQLEKHNETRFSDGEFQKVLNHLAKGNVFEKAKALRDKMHLLRDDGKNFCVNFFNARECCQNEFQ